MDNPSSLRYVISPLNVSEGTVRRDDETDGGVVIDNRPYQNFQTQKP